VKATVRYGPCPECSRPEHSWIVTGPDGSCWLCTRDWNRALRYAIERTQQQPATGVQVDTTNTVRNLK